MMNGFHLLVLMMAYSAHATEDCYPDAVVLDFYSSCSVTVNNLGGQGPNANDLEQIRYAHVGDFNGESFDMIVEVASGSDYVPAVSSNNGLNGKFGIINLRAGETVDIKFSFVDSATDAAVTLPYFYFSFFDLDQGGNTRELLCIDDIEYSSMSMVENNEEIDITTSSASCSGMAGTPSTTLSTNENSRGFGCDNPSDPTSLGIVTCADCSQCEIGGKNSDYFPMDQRNRSVSFTFLDTNHFDFTFEIENTGTSTITSGRNLLFAGRSSVSPCPDPSPQPTQHPSQQPTKSPTYYPTYYPTYTPTKYPTYYPTPYPTKHPSYYPTPYPTKHPSYYPTPYPTKHPSYYPTPYPTKHPTYYPTPHPTENPTKQPVTSPTASPVASPVAPPTGSNGGGGRTCFSADDKVKLESGKNIPFREIQVGDSILSANRAGDLSYSNVVFLPHGENDQRSKFVEVITSGGKNIKMTRSHLVPLCSGELSVGANLKTGSCLRTVDGDDEVLSTSMVELNGVYTAVTQNEFLVVNDIIASPFAAASGLVHAYFNLTDIEEWCSSNKWLAFENARHPHVKQVIGELAAPSHDCMAMLEEMFENFKDEPVGWGVDGFGYRRHWRTPAVPNNHITDQSQTIPLKLSGWTWDGH